MLAAFALEDFGAPSITLSERLLATLESHKALARMVGREPAVLAGALSIDPNPILRDSIASKASSPDERAAATAAAGACAGTGADA